MKKSLLLLVSIVVSGVLITNAQSVPNNNLDAWINTAGPPQYDDPAGWTTLNPLSGFFFGGNPISVFKSNDAQAGLYAAKIKTVVLTTNPNPALLPDTVGMMFTGNFDFSGIYFGYPFTSKPEKLIFYSKYTPNGADTAYVSVVLTKWNATTMLKDTLAKGWFSTFSITTTYDPGEVVLVYDPTFISLTPDSATILISSSGDIHPKEGSEFFIDSFDFTGVVVDVKEHATKSKINVYPNPAFNYALITVNTGDAAYINVYNIAGQILSTHFIENKVVKINTSAFAGGLYFYSVVDKNSRALNNGKFSVVK